MLIVVRCAKVPTLALCAVLAPALAAGVDWSEQQLATAGALRDRALSGTSAYEHVTSLVTEVGPRSAGSSGDAAAVRWALNKLGSLGFSQVRSQDVLVPRWVRGHAEVTLAGPNAQSLVAVALGGSVGTSDEGVEAQVLEVASLDALNALPATTVGGKIVFINQRMERTRDGAGYGATVRNRTEGPSAAGHLGAAALLIRSVGTSDQRHGHTGSLNYRVDAPRIPALALSNPDADQLARWLKPGKPVRVRVKSTARELPSSWSANVIGEIPGSERPNEVVLLGAHLDSWDLGQGAIDDGAGVAIVVEAARLIGRLERKPARTVRVVLFANEEFGLSGAKEYARLVGDAAARHVLAVEADLGAGAVWRIQSKVAPDAVPAVDAIREALKPLALEAGNNEARGGSDLRPLHALGVPILDLSQDATNYFDVHHTVNDTLLQIDPKTLNQVVAAYAVTAYLAASKNGDFGRVATEEKEQR
jgi:carboxypeptidase Q